MVTICFFRKGKRFLGNIVQRFLARFGWTLKKQETWSPSSRREEILTAGINPAVQVGLEIGALNSPIIRKESGDIRYVDYATTDVLKERHANHPDRVANMVEVNYVWQGSGSLSEIVGGTDIFDYVIAVHVIEHVPNVLGWFRGLYEVMKPGGIFHLVIPDRRFTFDITCPESTLGELVEADLLKYTRPSIRQMFDNCYYAKAIEPGAIWTKEYDLSTTPAFAGSTAPDLALEQAHAILNEERYVDSHCWIFTPMSFLDLIAGAARLGLFPFIPKELVPTCEGEFEFFFSVSKPSMELSQEDLRLAQEESIAKLKGQLIQQQRSFSMLTQ